MICIERSFIEFSKVEHLLSNLGEFSNHICKQSKQGCIRFFSVFPIPSNLIDDHRYPLDGDEFLMSIDCVYALWKKSPQKVPYTTTWQQKYEFDQKVHASRQYWLAIF